SGQEGTGQQGGADQAAGQQGGPDQAAGQQGGPDQAAGQQWAADVTTPQSPEELSRAGWELPWAESPVNRTGPKERAELELAFATAMRRTGSLMQLMGQAAADRIGINSTDLNCLNILSFRGQMTAGDLAKATGLTTASITGVIDRLEE